MNCTLNSLKMFIFAKKIKIVVILHREEVRYKDKNLF